MNPFMEPMPNTPPDAPTDPPASPPAPRPTGRVPAIEIVAVFALANVISVPIIGAVHLNFLEGILSAFLIGAFYASELVLLGVWCALGRTAYWIRLLMTAVGAGVLFGFIVWGLAFREPIGQRIFDESLLYWIAASSIVIMTAISVLFLKFTGMKTFHLQELQPGKETELPRWQFSIADVFLTTTVAAIVAAVWGQVFRSELAFNFNDFIGAFVSIGLFGGSFMLTGVIGMLAVLPRGNPTLRIIVYCGLMTIPCWVVALLSNGDKVAGYFLLFAAMEGTFLLVTFGVVRASGLRVTWSKSVPGPSWVRVGVRSLPSASESRSNPTPPLSAPPDVSSPDPMSGDEARRSGESPDWRG